MLHYVALTTGSCGNAYVFYDGETTIAIDCGVTWKKFSTELEAHSIPLSSLSALFLTHLHPDHAKGVGVFQRKTGLPVFVSSVCMKTGKTEMTKLNFERSQTFSFTWGVPMSLGAFTVTPFQTSHDSPGSSGYFLTNGENRIFLMTDTGEIPPVAWDYARLSKVKFIESNYDEDMLFSGPYPDWLKRRVSGSYGHLSNDEALAFAKDTSSHGDQVYFIHVSENNNDTRLIREGVVKEIPSGIFCKVCERGEMFEGFCD